MEKIISFIVENWRIIVDVFGCVFCLVVFLLRKKPVKVVDGVESLLLKFLPVAINIAEKEIGSGHGFDKQTRVLELCEVFLKDSYPDINILDYTNFIIKFVENILSTPQKKGD